MHYCLSFSLQEEKLIWMILDVYCESWNVNALPEDLWKYVRTTCARLIYRRIQLMMLVYDVHPSRFF